MRALNPMPSETRKLTFAQWAVMLLLWDAGASGLPPSPDEKRSIESLRRHGIVEALGNGRYRLTEEGKRVYYARGRIKRR